MKNSVHDNGGFIGRVADYAATDYYISTTTVSGVSSTLNYEWYNHNRGSPTTEATMDQFFDVSQSDVSLGGTGSWTTDINWSNDGTSSTTVSKPSYLPNDKFALKLSGSITAPETGTYTIKAIGDDALDIFIDGSRILYWYGGHGFGGAPASATATINLVAGQSYSFVSRMQEGGYGDGKKVEWQKPSDSALSVIPISAFSSDQTTTSNANKKNTGVWSMDADYLNAEVTPQGYRYIKWHITDIRSMSASMTQISELYLKSNGSNISWGSATITNPVGNNPSSEQPSKLIDGIETNKVLDFNVDVDGGSIFIIDAGVGNLFNFDSYYYVTGNDTAARDPTSWTMEGSNDGTNYTVLHTVTNATITGDRRADTQTFTL